MKVLGVFPTFTAQTGGVQVSGQLAWQGICSRGRNVQSDFVLFSYGDTHNQGLAGATLVSARSKGTALVAALRKRWRVQTVLLWHLSLLKLLPFFRIPDAKTALFLHGIEAWKPQDWVTRRLLRRVDLFLSNSEYTWQRFLSYNPHYGEATYHTVHLGVDTPLDTPIAAPAHPPVVLMLSRLLRGEDYKGHREMIAAWPLVRERIPEAELWIAGDGDLRPDLQNFVRAYDLEQSVRFYGHVSEQEKQQLLTWCRCLALPSKAEGFGLVYLEAMRMGRPCLVSTVDAGREVVNPPEAGLAVTPQDPEALAEAVCRLVTPGQEWQHWSEQARCRYERHFTAEQFQQRLVVALDIADHRPTTADHHPIRPRSMVSSPRSSS